MSDSASSTSILGEDLPSDVASLLLALEPAPLPTLLLDEKGRVQFANRSARWEAAGAGDLGAWAGAYVGEGTPFHLAWQDVAEMPGVREVLAQDRAGGQVRRVLGVPVQVGAARYLVATVQRDVAIRSGVGQSLQALREDAMQAVVDAASEAMILFDSAGRCVLSNGFAQEATGYPPEELEQQTLRDLGLLKEEDDLAPLLAEAEEKGMASLRGILLCARGERLPVRGQVRPVLGSSSRVAGLFAFQPPRVTSGRLSAVRQSGGYARPAVDRASGSFARPATDRASGSFARPTSATARTSSARGVAPPATPRPAGERPPSGAGTAVAAPAKASAAMAAPTAPESDAPERKLSGGASKTLMGRPSPALQEKQEGAKPAERPAEKPGPARRDDEPFDTAQGTVELDEGDLEEARVSPPPPPRAGKAQPQAVSEIAVHVSANPSRVTSVGAGLEALLGYSRGEVTSWTAERWLRQVHQPALADQLSQMWAGLVGQRFEPGALPDQTMEYPLVRKDGTVVHCVTVWRAVQSEDGTFEGLELLIRPKRAG